MSKMKVDQPRKETTVSKIETPAIEARPLSSVPALKQPWEGGTFVGITMLADGKLYAIVQLDAKPPKRLTWKKAMEWAASVGGCLPSRPVAALMFALAKDLLTPDWYWTSEQFAEDTDYAWCCDFYDGFQGYYRQRSDGCAVAVRMIPLTL